MFFYKRYSFEYSLAQSLQDVIYDIKKIKIMTAKEFKPQAKKIIDEISKGEEVLKENFSSFDTRLNVVRLKDELYKLCKEYINA